MKVKKLCFVDCSNNRLSDCKITSLPIKEKVIIEKSIYYFDDPEPCFIHRSAVLKLIFTNIDDYFGKLLENDIWEIKWSECKEAFREIFDIDSEKIDKIMIS